MLSGIAASDIRVARPGRGTAARSAPRSARHAAGLLHIATDSSMKSAWRIRRRLHVVRQQRPSPSRTPLPRPRQLQRIAPACFGSTGSPRLPLKPASPRLSASDSKVGDLARDDRTVRARPRPLRQVLSRNGRRCREWRTRCRRHWRRATGIAAEAAAASLICARPMPLRRIALAIGRNLVLLDLAADGQHLRTPGSASSSPQSKSARCALLRVYAAADCSDSSRISPISEVSGAMRGSPSRQLRADRIDTLGHQLRSRQGSLSQSNSAYTTDRPGLVPASPPHPAAPQRGLDGKGDRLSTSSGARARGLGLHRHHRPGQVRQYVHRSWPRRASPAPAAPQLRPAPAPAAQAGFDNAGNIRRAESLRRASAAPAPQQQPSRSEQDQRIDTATAIQRSIVPGGLRMPA